LLQPRRDRIRLQHPDLYREGVLVVLVPQDDDRELGNRIDGDPDHLHFLNHAVLLPRRRENGVRRNEFGHGAQDLALPWPVKS